MGAQTRRTCALCSKLGEIRYKGAWWCRWCITAVGITAQEVAIREAMETLNPLISVAQSLDTGLLEFSPKKYFLYEWPSILDGFWKWQRVKSWRAILQGERREAA